MNCREGYRNVKQKKKMDTDQLRNLFARLEISSNEGLEALLSFFYDAILSHLACLKSVRSGREVVVLHAK